MAALSVCTPHARALPVHVALDWPSSTPASARVRAHIQAIETAGPNANARFEGVAGPKGTILNLASGVWKVEAFAPGYWSEGVEVVVAGEPPDGVRLVFWPAATLRGEVVTAGGEPLPSSLDVQLSATSASADEKIAHVARPDSSPPHVQLHCRINAGTWTCLAPAGVFDLRLEAASYAPRYEWGVRLNAAENVDLGRTQLLRTASLIGRAVPKDVTNPPGPCRATLRADKARRGAAEEEQYPESGPDAKTKFSVPLNARGYFQVVGLPPGRYAVAVGCQQASAFRELRVQADGETRIDPPLLLEDSTLDVSLTPKVDPEGQPWKLAVYATAPHYLLIAGAATTSADGRWIRHGLMAGKYRIVVRGSDGTSWLEKYFDLSSGSKHLSLNLTSFNVGGRVSLSSQPVRARLVFSNNAGGQSATFTSDNDGRFEGVLPVARIVQESTWTVEVHVAQPPVTQRLLNVNIEAARGGKAWLDLQLPAVAVRGSVVSANGQPAPGVQVSFEDSKGVQTTTGTDDAGRFEMPDLRTGKYTAMADSPDGSSDRIPFDVTEGNGSELKLVLNSFKRYSFNVVSSQGAVADAAVQVWITPGVPRAFVRTNQDGRFEVNLPPGTTEVGLTIGAQGYALKLTRVPISDSSNDSPDTRTVTLDTSAGRLMLNLGQPERASDTSAALYLVHNGAIQDARSMVGWGNNQVGTSNGPAVIEAIEPGDYALCSMDPAQVVSLWSGRLPSKGCSTGSLKDGETLSLSPR